MENVIAWPEKVCLVLWALMALWMLELAPGNPHAYTAGWLVALGDLMARSLLFLIPLWAFLRALDLIAGGPQSRAAKDARFGR